MGRPGDGHFAIADLQIGMMIRGLTVKRETRNECDRIRKCLEGVLLVDRIAALRPSRALGQHFLDVGSRQFHAFASVLDSARSNRSGAVRLNAGSTMRLSTYCDTSAAVSGASRMPLR